MTISIARRPSAGRAEVVIPSPSVRLLLPASAAAAPTSLRLSHLVQAPAVGKRAGIDHRPRRGAEGASAQDRAERGRQVNTKTAKITADLHQKIQVRTRELKKGLVPLLRLGLPHPDPDGEIRLARDEGGEDIDRGAIPRQFPQILKVEEVDREIRTSQEINQVDPHDLIVLTGRLKIDDKLASRGKVIRDVTDRLRVDGINGQLDSRRGQVVGQSQDEAHGAQGQGAPRSPAACSPR